MSLNSGVNSIAIDMKESKLKVKGNVDPVAVAGKLRISSWHTELFTVGPAAEAYEEDPKEKEAKKNNHIIPNDQIPAELLFL